MLTKLTIRNFKRFGEVEVELGNPVVLIGPNNSGKTSAMQALTLWDIGVKRLEGEARREECPGKAAWRHYQPQGPAHHSSSERCPPVARSSCAKRSAN